MKKIFMIIAIFFVILILASGSSYGIRPLTTEDAPTVGKGCALLELGPEWYEYPDGSHQSNWSYALTYGITNNFDIVIKKPYYSIFTTGSDNFSGLGDSIFAVKYRFIDEKGSTPSMGIKAFADVSDGCFMCKSGANEYGAIFFATKCFEKTKIHANLGVTRVPWTDGSNPDTYIFYGIAFEQPLSQRLVLLGESTYRSAKFSPSPALAQIALNYIISPSVTFDLGYSRGLNNDAPRNVYTTGLSIKF